MTNIQAFFKLESAGGILLSIAALLALFVENSSFHGIYDLLLTLPVSVVIGTFSINKPMLLWVNDGLMAIFFLLVSLEIKREVVEGELSDMRKMSLPLACAIGGFVMPALFYVGFCWSSPEVLKGWAIPSATDIAFALGVMTLLGKRVPEALKVCLVAIAIIDDILAIVIIALFYTSSLSAISLGFGCLAVLILAVLNYRGCDRLGPYLVTGVFLWVCVLKSGVHATLAGVVIGLFIPIKPLKGASHSLLKKLEHDLHPWVAFGILPIFAFCNAGVSLQGITADMLMHPITLGITSGLFIGAPLGVISCSWLMYQLKLSRLPEGIHWPQFIGMAMLTGIGFTMSLFIGTLSFSDTEQQSLVRLGVLIGSLLSALLGSAVLMLTSPKRV